MPKKVPDINFTLKRVFRKQSFRPYQREIITASLERHDVFVQAATSFGKSLCFQLPAVIDHGITIVVSPLLALMHNQVAALQTAGIAAATINTNTPAQERNAIYKDLQCGHPRTRLLYVTPELCQSQKFRDHLATVYEQQEFARLAIDEAHCISEWGHDFRPAYFNLGYFREMFPTVPIICLTATATPRVTKDIISTLNLDPSKLRVFVTSTARANLHFEVRYYSEENDYRLEDFASWLKAVYARRSGDADRATELVAEGQRIDSFPGIIYVSTRSESEYLTTNLRKQGIGAQTYHAGLGNLQRTETQNKWISGDEGFDIIVATTAFGMGIDKENVRFVVHWNMPKSFEGFYQEAGRAGRDGKASLCLLYYSREDRNKVANRVGMNDDKSGNAVSRGNHTGGNPNAKTAAAANVIKAEGRARSFQALVDYCEATTRCRHEVINDYFGGGVSLSQIARESLAPRCDFACDVCKDPEGVAQRKKTALTSEEMMSGSPDEAGWMGSFMRQGGRVCWFEAIRYMASGGAGGGFGGGERRMCGYCGG